MFYLRLRVSKMGVDYPKEVFLRTPISLLKKVMDFVLDQAQLEANTAAVTQAQTADLILKIAHGFSGSKRPPPKSLPRDFLPYPKYKPPAAASDEADAPTKFVLTELVKRFRIPVYVFTALNGRKGDYP